LTCIPFSCRSTDPFGYDEKPKDLSEAENEHGALAMRCVPVKGNDLVITCDEERYVSRDALAYLNRTLRESGSTCCDSVENRRTLKRLLSSGPSQPDVWRGDQGWWVLVLLKHLENGFAYLPSDDVRPLYYLSEAVIYLLVVRGWGVDASLCLYWWEDGWGKALWQQLEAIDLFRVLPLDDLTGCRHQGVDFYFYYDAVVCRSPWCRSIRGVSDLWP
jgi:hypothetical protein